MGPDHGCLGVTSPRQKQGEELATEFEWSRLWVWRGHTCPLGPGHLGALLPPTPLNGHVQGMEPREEVRRMVISVCVRCASPTLSVNF